MSKRKAPMKLLQSISSSRPATPLAERLARELRRAFAHNGAGPVDAAVRALREQCPNGARELEARLAGRCYGSRDIAQRALLAVLGYLVYLGCSDFDGLVNWPTTRRAIQLHAEGLTRSELLALINLEFPGLRLPVSWRQVGRYCAIVPQRQRAA